MNIVVLDGHALNPGDLSWEPLAALGRLTVHARTAPQDVVARLQDAGAALTNKTPLDAMHFQALSKLRYVGVLATGYNVVDTAAAAERSVVVTNVPAYGTASVAQAVIAHLMHFTHHVAEHAASVRAGKWTAAVDWCYWDYPLLELHGRTLGLIGFGRIAQAVAAIAHAMGMQIVVATRSPLRDAPPYVTQKSIDETIAASDVLSLHCPLTPQTQKLIDADRLRLMKRHAFLINTARGPLIDEAALAAALNAGELAGAGLDVLSSEPPNADNPLLSARNCWITPHLAWATLAARTRLLQTAVHNLQQYLNGSPVNVVNPTRPPLRSTI